MSTCHVHPLTCMACAWHVRRRYDAGGHGPGGHRQLAAGARLGHRCHHYNAADAKFTSEYNWQHCVGMHVGETYEVHWPHSAAGACGTKWQYQTPFYDGVFCNDGVISIAPLNTYEKIGVQGQVFTIVNDETYYQVGRLRVPPRSAHVPAWIQRAPPSPHTLSATPKPLHRVRVMLYHTGRHDEGRALGRRLLVRRGHVHRLDHRHLARQPDLLALHAHHLAGRSNPTRTRTRTRTRT